MKLKRTALAVAILAGAMTAQAGLRVGFSLVHGGGYSRGYHPAYSAVCNYRYGFCQPAGCAVLPYFWYWSAGYPGYVSYDTGDAPYASFSTESGDPAPVPVYKVPPPVFPTQPVTVSPLAFGWKQ